MGNAKFKPNDNGIRNTIVRNKWKEEDVSKYTQNEIVQNFLVVWLDGNSQHDNENRRYTLHRLHQVANCVQTFTDLSKCQQFLKKVQNEQIFLITSGTLGKSFVSNIHKYQQIDSMYIFCHHPDAHSWTSQWKKIKLVSNQIESICARLVQDVAQSEYNLISTSILFTDHSKSITLDQIDPSFMYSKLLKEILLEINYDDNAIHTLTNFCERQYASNSEELKIIEEFRMKYRQNSPIWWYTRECFIYQMLNRSLRMCDINMIALMGFVLKDIHQQISALYLQKQDKTKPFTVYRGQGMNNVEFEKLKTNKQGMMTFNSFLSTTTNLETAKIFMHRNLNQPDKTAILFHIIIDPRLTSTPFATIHKESYHRREREVLFSMHTMFIIESVEDNHDETFTVYLKSMSDKDSELTRETQQMRRELGDRGPFDRLGQLLIKLGKYVDAEELYEIYLDSVPQQDQKTIAHIYNQLGFLTSQRLDLMVAKRFLKMALDIQERLRPHCDLDLANTYSNMGLLCTSDGNHQNALDYHHKALTIREKLLEKNHPDCATTYNNIGLVYDQLNDFTNALIFYHKALKIYQKCLDSNHAWIATIYKNIGLAEISLDDTQNGLINLHKALDIREKVLPDDHPSLLSIYTTLADVYHKMNEMTKAEKYHRQAQDVQERVNQKSISD